jgi:hypothetical protein
VAASAARPGVSEVSAGGLRVPAAGPADGPPARGAAGAVNSSALRFADRTKRGSVSIAPDSEIARPTVR